MTEEMKQQPMASLHLQIQRLPREHVVRLIKQIGLMETGARFDIVVKHDVYCPARDMRSCTCKECDLEIMREYTA